MNLIVDFHIAHIVERIGIVILFLQKCHRILGSIGILSGRIAIVLQRRTAIGPCKEVAEVSKGTTIVTNRLGRIHTNGLTNGALVGIAVECVHELTIDIKLQMVVEERGVQCHTGCCTLEV